MSTTLEYTPYVLQQADIENNIIDRINWKLRNYQEDTAKKFKSYDRYIFRSCCNDLLILIAFIVLFNKTGWW